MQTTSTKKTIGVFTLAMINVVAIESLRNLPASAMYGFSLVFYYLLAAVFFFIPTALMTAELATTWPDTGGVYIWTRMAFGKQWGLFTIWLQWILNVVWYPTVLSFAAAMLAYLINPALATHKTYMLMTVLITWWCVTGINCFGLEVSSKLSMLGAIVGTIIPITMIIVLGGWWLEKAQPLQIYFSWHDFWPNLSNLDNLTFLTGIVFGLIGLEMSAVHAGDVKNPQRDFPQALLWSALIILGTIVFASLSVAMVIPTHQLSVLSGLTDAYEFFFQKYHLMWMTPVVISMILLGTIAGISAWTIGPTRGLLIGLKENELVPMLQKTNRYGMPVMLLIGQAVIVTILAGLFELIPSVNGAYWILVTMTAQLNLLYYLFFFAAGIRLRRQEKNVPGAYRIPGGRVGIWIVGIAGILSSLITFFVGFLPPPGIAVGSLFRYEAILVAGIVVFCGIPLLAYYYHQQKSKRLA